MKVLSLNRYSSEQILNQLQNQIGGEITTSNNESVLKIYNEFAKGSISQYVMKNGISYINYNITFEEDIKIKLISEHSVIYDFFYSLGSNLVHNFGDDSEERNIEKFRSAIFCSKIGVGSELHFSKDQLYEICNISVSSPEPKGAEKLSNTFIKDLQSIFKLNESEGSIAYIGSLNLKIFDRIHQLNETTQSGLVRALLIEATINTIIALQLQQHSDDLENKNLNFGTLTNSEMASIQHLSTIIKQHPEQEYTINSLCQQSGLPKAKLQEGFKLMHGLTVTNYIINVRILAAEHLIQTTDMNISEIVYSIGLTSRSYFSKIFKKKYKCSPKSYQENRQMVFMSA